MPLRNGKQYLKPHVCSACEEFHSHELFNYKCSSCSDVKHPQHTLTIDTTVLDNWVDEHTISSSTSRLQSLIDHFSKSSVSNHDNFLLLSTLLELRGEGKLLRAGDAVKILGTSGDDARGHILAAHVADWWNIRSSNAHMGNGRIIWFVIMDNLILPRDRGYYHLDHQIRYCVLHQQVTLLCLYSSTTGKKSSSSINDII